MTKTKDRTKPAPEAQKKGSTLTLEQDPDKPVEAVLAELSAQGIVPMASVLTKYSKDTYSDEVSLTDAFRELVRLSDASTTGDLAHAERLLSAQMLTLNGMFAALAHRAHTNSKAGYLGAADTYTRLALRAQSQSRQTAQTLFEMKHPRPVAFVQQANIANGPQQVNNGPQASGPNRTHAPARAGQNDNQPNRLLGAQDGERLDFGAQGATSRTNQDLAAVGEVDRTENS